MRSLQRVAAFLLPFAALTYLALQGGSYDIVIRQEEGIVLWVGIALAVALGVLPRRIPAREAAIPLIALAALVVWTALSLLWTSSAEATLAELARTLTYAGMILLAFCALGRTTWRSAAAGIAAAAVLVCGLAVLSRLTGELGDPNAISVQDRLSYPFYYWNAVAAWGAISIALALSWSASARSVIVRVVFAAALPVCALAVYLTYARAGVATSALAVVAVIALTPNRWVAAVHTVAATAGSALVILTVRDQPQIAEGTGTAGAGKIVGALAAAMALCAVVAAATKLLRGDLRWRVSKPTARVGVGAIVALTLMALVAGQSQVRRGWDEFRNQPVAAATGDPTERLSTLGGSRYDVWEAATEIFSDETALGTGPGTFEFAWNKRGGGEFLRDAHSLYFETAAELGFPGVFFLVVLLVGLLYLGFVNRQKLRRLHSAGAAAGLLAAFVVFLVYAAVDWIWEVPAVTALALASAAVACSSARTRRLRLRKVPRAAVAVGALAVAAIQIPGVVSNSAVRESQELALAGSLDAATDRATEAVDAAPWAASGYIQRGLIAERERAYDAAREDLQTAAEKEPDNWRPHVLLARVEARAGRLEQARAELREARRLRPKSPFVVRLGDVTVEGTRR